ncbi:MAG TPA: type II toxin-antitoxin system VapC family toxin [Tepidisphaeraceae bacterium]|nr:type II toxin-antitoxin system VapC family toxin [Tepidisphaeraceae bacterium]
MKLVIDASFVASLFIPDESSAANTEIVQNLTEGDATAPAIWQLEVANLLIMAERRKRIDSSQMTRLVEAWDALPIALQPMLTIRQRSEVIGLARKHKLSAYDATYLELALRNNAKIATLDDSLIVAAQAEGVGIAG